MSFLADKVVLLTGGASGIGLATSKELLNNNVKAVSIADINEGEGSRILQELSQLYGKDRVIFIRCDVTNEEDFRRAFQRTVDRFKQLDIVINNAGVFGEENWRKTLQIDLEAVMTGSYLAMHEFLPKFKSKEEAIILNIASIAGLYPLESIPTYGVSKAGVIHFGRALGGEQGYEKLGVRVITVCPGVVETPMMQLLIGRKNSVVSKEKIREEGAKLSGVPQSAEFTAKSIIKIIENAENGSVWVTENNKPPYELEVPTYKEMKVKRTL